MTTNIKAKLEGALELLHKAQEDLREAWWLCGDMGNRVGIATNLARLAQTIENLEDLAYPPENDLEISLEWVATSTEEMFRGKSLDN